MSWKVPSSPHSTLQASILLFMHQRKLTAIYLTAVNHDLTRPQCAVHWPSRLRRSGDPSGPDDQGVRGRKCPLFDWLWFNKKGVSTTQGTRCAMCRQSFPSRLIIQPSIIEDYNEDDNEVWFYEGRNGWWQYDQRTNEHIGKSSMSHWQWLIIAKDSFES